MKKLQSTSTAQLSHARTHYWHTYGKHVNKPDEVFRKWADYDNKLLKRLGDSTYDLLSTMASAEGILTEDFDSPSLESSVIISRPLSLSLKSLRIVVYSLVKSGPDDDLAQQELYSNLASSFLTFVILPYRPGPDECKAAARMRSEGKSIILMAPDDIDALGSALWTLSEMLEYKLFRVFIQGGVDADAVYSDWQVEKFHEETKQIRLGTRLQPVDKAIELRRENPNLWIKHPNYDNFDRAVRENNFIIIVGESASGKSTLALDFGNKQQIRGSLVLYTNIASLSEEQSFQIGVSFFRKLFLANEHIMLILDDLHCRPEIGRNLLSYFQLLQNTSTSTDIRIIAVCWPSYLNEFSDFQKVAESFVIEAADIKDRLVARFGGSLAKNIQNQILDFAENDLLILRLLLDLSKKHDLAKDYIDLAEEVWKHRSRELKGDYIALTRTVLVVSSLGQYECDVPEAFLRTQAGTTKDQLKELCRAKILIRRNSRYSLPHRSFARLLATYLSRQSEHWNWFKSHNGPKNTAELIFNYMQFLDPSEVWNVLELINKSGEIRLSSQSQQDAKFIIESWKSINALLRKIYDQQTREPTWGRTISSATFACEALSSVGKKKEAQGSIRFIRDIYHFDGNKLVVDVSTLSTAKDFEQIRLRMQAEELVQAYVKIYSLETAETLNTHLLHENWASGLILCAEGALLELDKQTLLKLAEAVEARAEGEGFFYPSRVPWVTARVLMGLGRCGRTIENSEVVRKAAHWLMRTRDEGGAWEEPYWSPGTGTWNTRIETTAMCLTALRSVGVSANNSVLIQATNWLYQQKKAWTEIGHEVDGAIAIESYLLSHRHWRDVIDQINLLSWWANGQAVWMYATETSEKTHQQSCLVAQVAAFLIKAMWSILRNDLPSLLMALGLYQSAETEHSAILAEMPVKGSARQYYSQVQRKTDSRVFDIALSYAEEDRRYVERVAKCLEKEGVKVFYDKFMQIDAWGKDLYSHLADVYRNQAKFCVMFLSKAYATKAWTNLERQNAQARAFQENEEYILPVRMDDTEVLGISPLLGYVNGNDYTANQLCKMIIAKLNLIKK